MKLHFLHNFSTLFEKIVFLYCFNKNKYLLQMIENQIHLVLLKILIKKKLILKLILDEILVLI